MRLNEFGENHVLDTLFFLISSDILFTSLHLKKAFLVLLFLANNLSLIQISLSIAWFTSFHFCFPLFGIKSLDRAIQLTIYSSYQKTRVLWHDFLTLSGYLLNKSASIKLFNLFNILIFYIFNCLLTMDTNCEKRSDKFKWIFTIRTSSSISSRSCLAENWCGNL